MEFSVSVRNGAPAEGFVPLMLVDSRGNDCAPLDVQYRQLAPLRSHNPVALDLLIVGAAVYTIDKLHGRRTGAGDCWTRDITATIPVSDPKKWKPVTDELAKCLSFLTGDAWRLKFSPLGADPVRLTTEELNELEPKPHGSTVCLFSGGLDSLIGCIDWLESSPGRLILVGHHDHQMPGPFTDQKGLLKLLSTTYGSRVTPVLTRVGHRGKAAEITLRGRSFLFLALGVFVASAVGPNVPLLMPENGTIALNVPLTPSRRGSCSTRTAHPYYLRSLQAVLVALGFGNMISNPLMERTKGEAVAHCLNQDLLRSAAPLSASCAKRGHKSAWADRSARQCGRCMPCIYRRAALHVVDLDEENYGVDVCDSVPDPRHTGANDVRACFSFLRREPSDAEVGRSLLVGGSLDLDALPGYAATVQRSMEEIRELLRDKGTKAVRRLAGV